MKIWEIDQLALFIAFVIPGFISIKAYQLIFPGNERSSADLLVDAIAYSCINYAVLAYPIVWVETFDIQSKRPLLFYIFCLLVLFIVPVFWAWLTKKIRTTQLFQKNAPHPTEKPWDYVFAQRKCYWVKITLKDGTMIAGKFAENSFASSAPAKEQIYLEETWVLSDKGGFERQKHQSEGVIVVSDEISTIELRSYSNA